MVCLISLSRIGFVILGILGCGNFACLRLGC